MSRPRLLIISFSDISTDARVLKQVRLFADTYEVITCGYGPAPDPHVSHIRLDDSHGFRKWRRRDLILRRFRKIYWNLPAVAHSMTALSSLDRCDVILANDIDTVGLALSLNPTYGVHADIHEYAPRQNEEILVWRVFVAPYVRWMCRKFLPQVGSMTTVGGGIAEEYRQAYGIPSSVVTNATPHMTLEPGAVSIPLRLVHSGASLRNRRLEVLVDAVMATQTDVTLDMYLMGNDPAYITELRERAAPSPRIRFPDPVPYRHLIARLNGYDVGIHVIAPSNFNNRWALPNKFFDYVQARLGIIVGPTVEMRHLLTEHSLGAVTADFDASSLTRVLDSLTPEQVTVWKVNADSAAHALSAEVQVEVWRASIAALMEEPPT